MMLPQPAVPQKGDKVIRLGREDRLLPDYDQILAWAYTMSRMLLKVQGVRFTTPCYYVMLNVYENIYVAFRPPGIEAAPDCRWIEVSEKERGIYRR